MSTGFTNGIDSSFYPPLGTPPSSRPPGRSTPPAGDIPTIPLEYGSQASLAVSLDINHDPVIEVILGLIKPVEAPVQPDINGASNDKIFYLEAHEMDFRLRIAEILAQDMMIRAQSSQHKDFSAKLAGLQQALQTASLAAAELYSVAGAEIYLTHPPSQSANPDPTKPT